MASGFLIKKKMNGRFKERIDLVSVKPYIKFGASAHALLDKPLPDDFDQNLLMYVPRNATGPPKYCVLWIVFGDRHQLK
jgi:hypothetical protein